MLKTIKNLGMSTKYIENTQGTFSIAWSVSLATILFAIGATYDVAQLSAAKIKSQSLADTVAIAAAVHVKQNRGFNPAIPTDMNSGKTKDDAYYEGITYTADQAGYNFKGMVNDGSAGVTFNIDYDDVLMQATVTVNGTVNPAFLQVTGKDSLPFKSVSIVKYFEEAITNPASVYLVLDNSGSMAFMDKPNTPNTSSGSRPSDSLSRISGLKQSVNGFMDKLNAIEDEAETASSKVLRMAMYPYASNGYNKPQIEADWKTISKSDVNAMNADGGTAPQTALKKAQDRLLISNSSISESIIHERESGNSNPFRFLVYMTDGQNSGELTEWTPRTDADYWRYLETRTETRTRGEWVTVTSTEPERCFWYHYDKKNRLRDHGDRKRHNYDNYYCEPEREVERQEYQETEYEETVQEWIYHSGTNAPDNRSWEEGVYDSQENKEVRELCTTMKDDGVEIFTVAYALDAGWYNTGAWGNATGIPTAQTTDSQSRIAKLLMKDCASTDQNFLDAIDTTALKDAFELIGEKIVADSIRIRS